MEEPEINVVSLIDVVCRTRVMYPWRDRSTSRS
jgi:hypothetical protein